jgi:plastocyanin
MSLSRAHRGAVFLGVLATVALAAAPAVAAPATVDVRDGSFAPGDVTIAAGETVTWSWSGSGHDVKLSGAEAFTTAFNDAGATYVHRFTTPGTYSYVCEAHAAMKGRVVVTAAAGAPAAAAAPAPAPAPVPAGPAPRVAALRTSPTGALVRFTLNSPATVRADVARWTPGGWRHVARTEVRRTAGRTVLRWTTGPIARGRYRVAVVAVDAAGRRSPAAGHRFRVRRAVPAAASSRPAPGAAAPAPAASHAPAPGEPAPPAPTSPTAPPQPADAVSPQGQGPAPVDGGSGDGGGGRGPGPG